MRWRGTAPLVWSSSTRRFLDAAWHHYRDPVTVSRSNRRGLPAAPPTSNGRTSAGLFFKNTHRFLNLGCISTTTAVGMRRRLFTALRPKLNKRVLATTVFNLGRIRVLVLTARP